MNTDSQEGFTLLELMIVIAIIGILAAISVPQYAQFTKRAKFADVITRAVEYKLPIGLCIQDNNSKDPCDTNYGDITPATPGGHLAGLTVTNGSITAIGTTEVSNAVYKLDPNYNSTTSTLVWSVDTSITNACQGFKLCK